SAPCDAPRRNVDDLKPQCPFPVAHQRLAHVFAAAVDSIGEGIAERLGGLLPQPDVVADHEVRRPGCVLGVPAPGELAINGLAYAPVEERLAFAVAGLL